jgi:hypothetical protein
LNHPVFGTAAIALNSWQHAAVTYDGTCWNLYLNGMPDGSDCPGRPPRSDSIQHFDLGTAMTSGGTPAGFFAGDLDEVRVWNRALPQAEIQTNMNRQVASGSGLIGRWGLNEGTGTSAGDSTTPQENGTVVNAAWLSMNPAPVGTNSCEHTPLVCSDSNACTTDSCDTSLGCVFATVSCGDNNACTTDSCDAILGCVHGPVNCDDLNPCTADSCNTTGGCTHDPISLGQTSCGTGSCRVTVDLCVNGLPQTCTPGQPATEICDGLDNDCDGSVDEGDPGSGNACSTGSLGVCAAGTTACTNGAIVCSQNVQSSAEICDGLDNDCDGSVDEGNPGSGAACSTGNLGVCAAGTTACSAGAIVCNQNVQPSPEACNGLDDDCDGVIDNGEPGGGASCTVPGQQGLCSHGVTICTPTGPACQQTVQPAAETCDGLDNDCDGQTDEGLGVLSCGLGQCAMTVPACVAGTPGVCVPGQPATEVCDGLDNDCDGATDEGLGSSTCGVGACRLTVDNCVAGHPQTCTPGPSSPEICDGIDNDCDNLVDEGLGQTACGLGPCQHTVDNCVGGVPQTCTPGAPSAESCNNVDDDCNGLVDDGLGVISCGSDSCTNVVPACVNGQPGVCVPLAGNQPAVVTQFGSSMKYRANGPSTAPSDVVLVQFDAPMRYLANTSDPGIGLTWTQESFSETGWQGGTYGVGYDTGAAPNATALLRTTVPAGTLSVFTRADLTITDVNAIRRLLIGADYDDGFVAWVNGVEVARSSTMPAGSPAWNTSPALHESSNGSTPNYGTMIDISSAISYLHNGTNSLAIGVWNDSAPSTDLVLVPKVSIGFDTNPGPGDLVLTQIGSPMRYLANASDPGIGLAWTGEAFNDAPWSSGTYGVGYETVPPGAVNLIRSSVPAGTLSVFTRTTLSIPDVTMLRGLYLGADYDDGFVAYLNGVEVARSSSMPAGDPAWNAPAASHESSNGTTPNYGVPIDISQALPLLHNGDNVLAIGVWNIDAASTDLVLVPKLSIGFNWAAYGYDDTAWATGQYGVGYETSTTAPMATALLKTTVPAGTLSVFTRTHFNVADPATVPGVYLGADYDDGFIAYINGVEVYRSPEMPLGPISISTDAASRESSNGATPNYGTLIDVSSRARAALRAGDNVLAIGVWNFNASASTDLVLVPYLSLGESELCNGIDDNCNGLIDEGFPDQDHDGLADCVDPDDDNDGTLNGQDCRPYDPLTSAAPPAEVAGLQWVRSYYGHMVMLWGDQGPGLRYDIAGGLISRLRPEGGVVGATCVAGGDNLPLHEFDDPRPDPAPGQGYYYIIRSESDVCGGGTYGYASSGAERLPVSACP